jgi:hypothetical protein
MIMLVTKWPMGIKAIGNSSDTADTEAAEA